MIRRSLDLREPHFSRISRMRSRLAEVARTTSRLGSSTHSTRRGDKASRSGPRISDTPPQLRRMPIERYATGDQENPPSRLCRYRFAVDVPDLSVLRKHRQYILQHPVVLQTCTRTTNCFRGPIWLVSIGWNPSLSAGDPRWR
jgi:hypothetical protein